MQQVLRGTKKAKNQVEISHVQIPLWPELSLAAIYPAAMRIPGLLDHFPDEWSNTKRVDRKFFWAILTTDHPEYVKNLIRGARDSRNAHQAQRAVPQQLMLPNPEWVNLLLQDSGFVPARR